MPNILHGHIAFSHDETWLMQTLERCGISCKYAGDTDGWIFKHKDYNCKIALPPEKIESLIADCQTRNPYELWHFTSYLVSEFQKFDNSMQKEQVLNAALPKTNRKNVWKF